MLWGNEVLRLLDFSFPLHATIIHKVHGLTLDEIVFDMKGKHFSAGQAYVASVVESARTLQGLHILNFNLAAIRKSLKVESEMERLVNKCVQPIPSPCFISFLKDITIALLNVRSIINKVVDIKHDSILQAADVLCFSETWLKPSDPTPCVKPNHNVERCDGRGGGIMVTIPNTMQYARLNNIITTNGIDL